LESILTNESNVATFTVVLAQLSFINKAVLENSFTSSFLGEAGRFGKTIFAKQLRQQAPCIAKRWK